MDGIDFETLDLRSFQMQFCDGCKLNEYNSDTQKAYEIIDKADGLIIGMLVYCYSVLGPLKNFIDITCSAVEEKVVDIICTTGSSISYLASADLAKILTYESRVLSI